MYKNRLITERLKTLVQHFPCVILSGARQVGKSTLLKHLFSDTHDFVVFDPVMDIQNARQDPDLFLRNHPGPLILDEIQYAPELIPAIKRSIDINRSPGRFIITGSQQWQVMQHAAESLAGRAVFLDLEGFSLSELSHSEENSQTHWLIEWLKNPDALLKKKSIRLPLEHTPAEILWRGFLPEATLLPLETISDYYFSYQRTYIERGVR